MIFFYLIIGLLVFLMLRPILLVLAEKYKKNIANKTFSASQILSFAIKAILILVVVFILIRVTRFYIVIIGLGSFALFLLINDFIKKHRNKDGK